MNSYIIHDSQGNIISCGESPEQIDQRFSSEHTQLWMEFPSDIENYRVIGAALVRIPDTDINERESLKLWESLRSYRDLRLTSSDWTQVADALVDKAAWATYRQQLRDLPSNTTDLENPVWPTPPQ